MDRAVVLLSGGMDSATLLRHVRFCLKAGRVHALTFYYGQKHRREIAMARWQARAAGVEEHREINLGMFAGLVDGGSALTDEAIAIPDLSALRRGEKRQPATYVPNRNMVLLSLAAAYAEARGIRELFYGAQAQDEYGYWDCTEDFVAKLNAVLRLNRRKAVRIRAPFATFRKVDVLRMGLKLGVEFLHTWTCYRGAKRACGNCPSCVERAGAFRQAGQADPLERGRATNQGENG